MCLKQEKTMNAFMTRPRNLNYLKYLQHSLNYTHPTFVVEYSQCWKCSEYSYQVWEPNNANFQYCIFVNLLHCYMFRPKCRSSPGSLQIHIKIMWPRRPLLLQGICCHKIFIIINIKDWTLWSVPPPDS